MASLGTEPGTVHVIDNDAAVRRSVVALLHNGGLAARGFDSALHYLDEAYEEQPTCIVTAIRMPQLTGIQLIEQLRQRGHTHPVIAMTGYGDTDTAIRAFRLGVVDFFEKPVAGSLLLDAVQRAIDEDRRTLAQTAQAEAVNEKLVTLSRRERQVMGALISGSSNKQIAWQLELSEKTVAAHRANMLAKMQVESLAELIVMVVSTGLYDTDRGELIGGGQTNHWRGVPHKPQPVTAWSTAHA